MRVARLCALIIAFFGRACGGAAPGGPAPAVPAVPIVHEVKTPLTISAAELRDLLALVRELDAGPVARVVQTTIGHPVDIPMVRVELAPRPARASGGADAAAAERFELATVRAFHRGWPRWRELGVPAAHVGRGPWVTTAGDVRRRDACRIPARTRGHAPTFVPVAADVGCDELRLLLPRLIDLPSVLSVHKRVDGDRTFYTVRVASRADPFQWTILVIEVDRDGQIRHVEGRGFIS